MSELLLGEAFKIAVGVHGEQRDKSGEPYMGHICRVMSAMDTDTERCVAILHDSIEDSGNRAVAVGHAIFQAYGVTVGDAVIALTRLMVDDDISGSGTENSSYMNYIRRLSRNPLAVKVKLADLQDNRRRDRLRKLPSAEANRLFDRYEEAYCFLVGRQWEHEDAAEDAAQDARFEAQRTVCQRADGTLHRDKEEYDREMARMKSEGVR